jgi:hypothetical protein
MQIESCSTLISCGVPEGSFLTRLLFLLCISDVYLCSNLPQFHLFAEDACLIISSSSKENCIQMLDWLYIMNSWETIVASSILEYALTAI